MLFLRHKIQKAVIPKSGDEIKAEDMKSVSHLIPRSRALRSLYMQILAEDADTKDLTATLDKQLVINNDTCASPSADTAIPAQRPDARPANNPHSRDLWV